MFQRTFEHDDEVNLPTEDLSALQATQGKQQAEKDLKRARENAGPTRDQFPFKCAKEWETIRGGDQAAIIRRMRAVKNRRKQDKKLQRAFRDDNYKRLNFILVPKSQNWERIVEPTKIVKNILQRNKQHFNQASETPFGQETIQKLLGWSGTSKECVNLMNGKVPSELWKQCTQPCAGDLFALFGEEPLSVAPDEISFQEMKAAYQAWPEKTATSPLGRNLSHYKALLIQDTKEQENQTGENYFRLITNFYQLSCAVG